MTVDRRINWRYYDQLSFTSHQLNVQIKYQFNRELSEFTQKVGVPGININIKNGINLFY